MNNPEKYAINSEKARNKVKSAKRTFEKIKEILDEKTIEEFETAFKRYRKKLR